MTLEIPQFAEHPYLEYIEICAFLNEGNPKVAAWEKLDSTATYEANGRKVFGGLSSGWAGDAPNRSLHIHIRFADAAIFVDRKEPNVNAVVSDIVSAFGLLAGESADIRWDARFVVPLTAVPPTSIVIPLIEIEAKSLNLSMRVSGGQFSIETPPLDRLWWTLRERGDDPMDVKKAIIVDVVGFTSEQLDDKLFERALRGLTPAFDAFIFGGERRDVRG